MSSLTLPRWFGRRAKKEQNESPGKGHARPMDTLTPPPSTPQSPPVYANGLHVRDVDEVDAETMQRRRRVQDAYEKNYSHRSLPRTPPTNMMASREIAPSLEDVVAARNRLRKTLSVDHNIGQNPMMQQQQQPRPKGFHLSARQLQRLDSLPESGDVMEAAVGSDQEEELMALAAEMDAMTATSDGPTYENLVASPAATGLLSVPRKLEEEVSSGDDSVFYPSDRRMIQGSRLAAE